MEQKIGTQSKKKSVSFTPSTEGCGMSSEPNKDKETNERENWSQEGVSSPKNDQPKTAILKNKTLSRDESREIVNSLRESLESTPHSDVKKNSTETPENKGPRWRVVIPVVCLIAISLIVVIVISVTTSPSPTITKIDGKSPTSGKQYLNLFDSELKYTKNFKTISKF